MGINAVNHTGFSSQVLGGLYEDDADRKKHMHYMASIADEERRDISEVTPYYEHILGDLRGQARVHDYLNIFVAKRVLAQLNASR